MKKIIIKFLMVSMMTFLFSINAYATPVQDKTESKDHKLVQDFDLTLKDLIIGESYSVQTDNRFITIEYLDDLDNVNDYKVFQLNKGFSRQSIITFANERNVSGKGVEGTKVGILAYTYDENDILNIQFQNTQKIGASGLYNQAIPFQVGENYILIAISKDDSVYYRIYQVKVKEEETRELLENIQIQFVDPQVEEKQNEVDSNVIKTVLEQVNKTTP